ncbi:uncharacterized protein LOC141617468 [Silene latifolia]|uniref:uncharacterized protein LOC141617468 n=1 Tax=Silene latifolia TaxID=37657 RepID=UPI003D7822EB
MGPVWYLGERLARQCFRGALTVPVDPPRTMFREPSEAEREADLAGASGDDLLLPEEDYSAFLYGRLAYWPVVEVEAAGIEPPEYPETLEYTDATGRTTISELRDFDVAVTDAGLDDWQHLIRRVAPSRFVALWRVANRLRATAIEALVGGRGRQPPKIYEEKEIRVAKSEEHVDDEHGESSEASNEDNEQSSSEDDDGDASVSLEEDDDDITMSDS